MLLAVACCGLLLPLVVSARPCEENKYWSTNSGDCLPCSKCLQPEVVIRPCQVHKDTVCGPLSALGFDWPWIKDKKPSRDKAKEMMETFKENLPQIKLHEKHQREKLKKQKNVHVSEDGSTEDYGTRLHLSKLDSDKILWKKLKYFGAKEEKASKNSRGEEVKDDVEIDEELVSDDLTAIEKQRHLENIKWKSMSPRQNYLNLPFDLSKNTEHKIHFDDSEAFELLDSSSRKKNINENQFKSKNLNEKDFVEMSDIFETLSSKRRQNSSENNGDYLKFDENGNLIRNFRFTSQNLLLDVEPKSESISRDNFSSTERLVLDWQTIILAVAVFSCLLFFLVAGIYSIQHAREWKKIKTYFDTDVDELQSWLSPSKDCDKKKSFSNSGIYKTTTEVVHKENSPGQCKYLERIIHMKGSKKLFGASNNVYHVDKEMKLLKGPTNT